MKPNLILAAILLIFFSYGCSQPVGTSTSLLTSESSNPDDDGTSTDTGSSDGQLEMIPDNSEMVLDVDDSDKIEITGKCVDLDRRKNRIFVEVFAGEDETATPYISNGISDFCLNAGSGLGAGETCFWVTKGIGIVEPAPVNRSFPQCHNGVFGFAVKLGKVLVSGPPNLKYTVRFKIRTLDGILSDSQWNRVTVSRNLSSPSINKISANDSTYTCAVETSPARFNQTITYMLSKTVTGTAGTSASIPLFQTRQTTASVTTGQSVFNWDDSGQNPAAFTAISPMVAGTTNNYTLDSRHDFNYAANPYGVPPTATSNLLSCTITRPQIFMSAAPTNFAGGTGPTCYLAPSGGRKNPNLGSPGYYLEWSTGPAGWTGFEGSNSGSGAPVASCPNGLLTNCTATNLVATAQYFFAVREVFSLGAITILGKWSNEVACTPPAP